MISRTLAQIAETQSAMPFMTCLGLVIFLTFFVSMLFWTARSGSRGLYQAMSQMPLEAEQDRHGSNNKERV
jgi:hypothetical protein